jgi:hypothetical protein
VGSAVRSPGRGARHRRTYRPYYIIQRYLSPSGAARAREPGILYVYRVSAIAARRSTVPRRRPSARSDIAGRGRGPFSPDHPIRRATRRPNEARRENGRGERTKRELAQLRLGARRSRGPLRFDPSTYTRRCDREGRGPEKAASTNPLHAYRLEPAVRMTCSRAVHFTGDAGTSSRCQHQAGPGRTAMWTWWVSRKLT